MKKILVVVIVAVLGLGAFVANAQVPHIQIYFDEDFQTTQVDCPSIPPEDYGTVSGWLWVVANNLNMWVSGVEYMIDYPAEVEFVGDFIDEHDPVTNPDGTQLKIGQSDVGIGITWHSIPANGWSPVLCQKARYLWWCGDCSVTNIPWDVEPHPQSGKVQAIRFPDNARFDCVGMRSYICATVPVEETTWGGVKALYE